MSYDCYSVIKFYNHPAFTGFGEDIEYLKRIMKRIEESSKELFDSYRKYYTFNWINNCFNTITCSWSSEFVDFVKT